MLLSDKDIRRNIKQKNIIIKPIPDFSTQLGPCSLDLRLGTNFRVFEYTVTPYIDIQKGVPSELTRPIKIPNNVPFTVQPGELVLASTAEWIELPDNIAARLEGRSSLGRIGIIVHATAQLIPPGWRGNLVLELSNIARLPVALYPGMRVCALSFEEMTSNAETPYYKNKMAKYVNQKGSVASKIDKKDLS
ncbi:dCTP deaminase [Candidatus Roizmanbacteria bacterium RIFCSPLOWO2_02_FULL_37_19]|uniref:dCTP deaminase n=1 Tax=Candidatus Roizmanbacteria bacterium RIFCSPHIGHO2_02_FULL_37_24 TaxID=1802037 RepID=A0A1F7GVF0_9BACT|nr:MAG: dCTP deaminase [Candidatus Roizmanbacteria bacterium RIFCSPHIGHO2_01_FULL_38_41]OGK22938.1 MAG: dCTP deaminase [Candidatus Roizmanbacteria bacterium RIFCSPHIGHO2_02_FULL_37_24]OGK33608.1 MAG: dCTP deaminase [Candidatus Roizmanbacteria bacterium RIFCSPHIGHO2_12_FULL_37_23]OGK44187.1 MAG: dCTP deaminase [Candidatus Roizmanbacteria bacterium RIFCSPLOWO2_01_FULL_37_57]OGK55260.1 MAG: dCTP deaminase [Candidatus Roizmanbacteria bacterium RIFCSPLOWO2_02_FULL_37_19]OGK60117.1 MAG: dCTP deamina